MKSESHDLSNITRRRWVKQFMLGSVVTLSGNRWAGTALADVTQTGPGPAVIRLKVSDLNFTDIVLNGAGQYVPTTVYPLSRVGGSVQYRFNGSFVPFTLNRVQADRFVTLDSVCTHFGCGVGRYKRQLEGNDPEAFHMRCPCHGSRYDIEGKVFRDGSGQSTEPAQSDLGRYETVYDAVAYIVSITIPGMNLNIESVSIHQNGPGDAVRLKLVIPVTSYSTYKIMFQPDLAAVPVQVPFSTTPNGVADQFQRFQTTSGSFIAYVDANGPRGFFSVGLVIDEVEL